MNSRFFKHQSSSQKVLEANDLPSLAKYMQSDSCRNVFLMVPVRANPTTSWDISFGVRPGISTSAGIPDFRSPDTGLYANLARLNLPYPEAVFQIDFFRKNPVPFYTLAKELYPGRYRPTITHSFIKVLHAHGLLHTCFTQNIDTLERRAGVPEGKIIEAHGSFAAQRCIECRRPYDAEKIKKAVQDSTIPRCEHCNGLVKPDIVFFGEALPPKFHASIRSLHKADLLIVIGTSLTVHPFASLVDLVPSHCPRVLINLDRVGNFNKGNDVVLLGKCDDVVRKLSHELGWEEELEKAWVATAGSVEVDDKQAVLEPRGAGKELDRITRDMETSLTISNDTEPVANSGTNAREERAEEKEVDKLEDSEGKR